MAFYCDLPVGIILYCKNSLTWQEENHGMFFVKKYFRSNGIATNMFYLMKTRKNNLRGSKTNLRGNRFFDKIQLERIEEW